MTLVRGQLGDRLGRQLAQAYRQWRHPTSGRRPGTASCSRRTLAGCGRVRGGHQPSGHRPRFRNQQRTLSQCPRATAAAPGRHPRWTAGCVEVRCSSGGRSGDRRPLPQPAERARTVGRRQPHVSALLGPAAVSVRTAPPPGRSFGRTADTATVSGSAHTRFRSAVGRGDRQRSQQPQAPRHCRPNAFVHSGRPGLRRRAATAVVAAGQPTAGPPGCHVHVRGTGTAACCSASCRRSLQPGLPDGTVWLRRSCNGRSALYPDERGEHVVWGVCGVRTARDKNRRWV
jgi:hypothetical protein